MVLTVPAPNVLVPVFGVPEPMMEIPIPLGTVIPLVHAHEPAGIWIVSPSTALCMGPLMTAFTFDWLQEAAVKVPCAFAEGARKSTDAKNKTIKKLTNRFILSAFPIRYRTLSP